MSGEFDKPFPNNTAVQQQGRRCDKESEGSGALSLGLSAHAVSVSSSFRSPFSMLGPNWAVTLAREICQVSVKWTTWPNEDVHPSVPPPTTHLPLWLSWNNRILELLNGYLFPSGNMPLKGKWQKILMIVLGSVIAPTGISSERCATVTKPRLFIHT